ncbi:MAG: DNA-binding LacI/PurR family transcriptional regulator [Verrucomicrobiales bacterium]|jgi:DNA-binding LacI/PurR family transcriptional regulator
MADWRRLSATEQFTAHLRDELSRGRWVGTMPGVQRLAAEFTLNRKTAEAALQSLENEGLLKGQGPGRKRRIVLPKSNKAVRPMRLAILPMGSADSRLDYIIDLQHALDATGHSVVLHERTLVDLGMDAKRVARFVKANEADAWVVLGGSREVLGWFAAAKRPTFALFGRYGGLPLAACKPDKPRVFATATRRLIELGHRRIVLLCREIRRLPEPGESERAFLDELKAHDIAYSTFNLPSWEESAAGLRELLANLFVRTPPTALIIEEAPLFFAALQFLASQGIRVPGEVSLVCTDPDPSFDWSDPPVAHIRWDGRPLVRRIVCWAANVSRGTEDIRQTSVPAEFVEGGTVGEARE